MTAERTTTIRAPAVWLDELDHWAISHGVSRTAALLILVRVGMRALQDPRISEEQIEDLIADE